MPKLYEYLGIIIMFYSNEHEPIHVHGQQGEFESKAEFFILDGKIEEIIIKTVTGRKPLKNNDLKNFQDFLKVYADKIVDKWVDFFVYHKEIKFERITQKL
jgi:hypothetical protein